MSIAAMGNRGNANLARVNAMPPHTWATLPHYHTTMGRDSLSKGMGVEQRTG